MMTTSLAKNNISSLTETAREAMMDRIFSCMGNGEVRQMALLEPERTLEQIHESANDLSLRILSNNATYERLKGNYMYRRCTELLHEIEVLDLKHESEQREKQTLKEEFHHYLGNHLSPEGENPRQQAREVEKLLATEDDLRKTDLELDDMRDGTFDVCQDFRKNVRCGFFGIVAFIACCPFLSICNPVCCGLYGRVEQLKYAVKKGIA